MAFYERYLERSVNKTSFWTPRDEKERKKFENYKSDIKTFLTISKEGIPVRTAYKQITEAMEDEIKYTELGFQNFGEFLFHCQDVLEVRSDIAHCYYLFLKGYADEETEHLRRLVQGQTKAKSKRAQANLRNTKPCSADVLLTTLNRSIQFSSTATRGSTGINSFKNRNGLPPRFSSMSSVRKPSSSSFSAGKSFGVYKTKITSNPSRVSVPTLKLYVPPGLRNGENNDRNLGNSVPTSVQGGTPVPPSIPKPRLMSTRSVVSNNSIPALKPYLPPEKRNYATQVSKSLNLHATSTVARPNPFISSLMSNTTVPLKSIKPKDSHNPVPILRPFIPVQKIQGEKENLQLTVEKVKSVRIPEPYPPRSILKDMSSKPILPSIPVCRPVEVSKTVNEEEKRNPFEWQEREILKERLSQQFAETSVSELKLGNNRKSETSLSKPSLNGYVVPKRRPAPPPSEVLTERLQIYKTGKQFAATLLGADSFGFLIFRIDQQFINENFTTLEQELQKFYGEAENEEMHRLQSEIIEVGLAAVAKIDGKFVRVRIFETHKKKDLCLVFCLEDHEFTIVNLTDLYFLNEKFYVPRPGAILCRLDDIDEAHMMMDELTDAFENTPVYPPDVMVVFKEDDPKYNVPVVSMTLKNNGKDLAAWIKHFGGKYLKEVSPAEMEDRKMYQNDQREMLITRKYLNL